MGNPSRLLEVGSIVRIGYGLLSTIVLGILLLLVLYVKNRSRRLPPGPIQWPIVGSLHLVARGGLFHHVLASLAKVYGPLMTLKLGSQIVVVATSSKMAKEILKTQNQFFCSKANTAAADIMNYHQKNIVWAPYGEYLRALRKLCLTELLGNKRIASFEKQREEEVLSSIYLMLEDCREGTVAVVLIERMAQLSSNIISRMLFGKSFFGLKSSTSAAARKEFKELADGIFHLSGIVVPGDFIPALKRFDIGGHEAKMKELATQGDQFYSRILEEHRNNSTERKEKQVPDFVDTLLALPAKDRLSETAMKAIIQDVILAGTDTSANTVCWTFAELMRHPEVMKKAVEELDTIVGRERLMTERDIPQLKYLQCIIKESFRLHPVAVLLLYESTEATTIDGYYIPAKSRILVNNFAISRSEENWENALEFIPERFFETTRDVRGQDFEMIPFGAGRRMCLGMNLGLVTVQLTVGQMLQTCNWSLPAGMNPEDVDLSEEAAIAVPLKFPLKVVATHRLAPSILNDFIASMD